MEMYRFFIKDFNILFIMTDVDEYGICLKFTPIRSVVPFFQVCQDNDAEAYLCGEQSSATFINDPARGLCLMYTATTDVTR